MDSIQRFIDAQQGLDGYISFHQAYQELNSGRKLSHWIWYIFPQLKQLGFSSIAQHFGILNFKEACEYLQNTALFQNYDAITQILEQQFKRNVPILTLMHGDTDAKKLASSLTLFREAAFFLWHQNKTSTNFETLACRCDRILKDISQQGYPPCERTLNLINQS